MTAKLSIETLRGGGLVLNWRCPSQCRHCLYGSGPHRKDGEPKSSEDLGLLLNYLVERAPQTQWHIGGGEPFLNLPLLKEAVSGLRTRGMALEYVETNASWVKDVEQAKEILTELSEVGLRSVLVSLSPFHAEFVPYAKTQALISAATQVLRYGAFIWVPEFADELAGYDQQTPVDLDIFLAERPSSYVLFLATKYFLVPGGRAGRFLVKHGNKSAPQSFFELVPCVNRLADTSHFHVDLEGNYVPGFCAGISLPIRELSGEINLEKYPLLAFLAKGDLEGLFNFALGKGFQPLEGYSSPCDLCTHLRFFLRRSDPSRYPELGPEGFYDPRSVPGFE